MTKVTDLNALACLPRAEIDSVGQTFLPVRIPEQEDNSTPARMPVPPKRPSSFLRLSFGSRIQAACL
jgi:hypothetical protein